MVVNMQPGNHDDLNEPRLTLAYRAAPRPEPSADLDSAILAAARREAHVRPQFAGSVLRRWQVPVSVAAVMLLSVTVVTLVMERGGGEISETLSPHPADRAPAAPQTHQDRVATAPATAKPQALPAPSTAPLPALEQRQGPPLAAALRERYGVTKSGESGSTAAAEAGVEAAAIPKRQAPLAGTADAQPGRQEAAAPKPKLREDASPTPAEARAPEPYAEGAPSTRAVEKAAAPAPQAAPAQGAMRTPSSESGMREQRAPSAQVELARKPMAVPAAPTPHAKALEGQPPERWLEKIDELRRSGRAPEADELLAVFRKRFPEHPAAHQ